MSQLKEGYRQLGNQDEHLPSASARHREVARGWLGRAV
jgi:hypothetical protein